MFPPIPWGKKVELSDLLTLAKKPLCRVRRGHSIKSLNFGPFRFGEVTGERKILMEMNEIVIARSKCLREIERNGKKLP